MANDNVPEAERWVPVAGEAPARAPNAALDRARREAEAVIAAHFPPSQPLVAPDRPADDLDPLEPSDR